MDANAIAGMIFVLMIIAMVGGVIVLLPITLRLGKVLERRLEQKENDASAAESRQLLDGIRSIQDELERLSERQAFTESLVNDRNPVYLKDESLS